MDKIKYQVPYLVRLRDGTICKAMLLRLNQYNGNKEVWKRLDDVPRKERYISANDVVAASPFS